jgi:hypothetical protein
MVTKKGPSKEEMDNDFTFTVIGKGWDKSAAKIDGEYINPPNKKAILKVQIQRSIMTYREYSSSLVIQLVRYKLLLLRLPGSWEKSWIWWNRDDNASVWTVNHQRTGLDAL